MSEVSVLAAFADRVRIPSQHDQVHNEECLFSFDNPESEDGLYICMERFLGFGRSHVMAYHQRTENNVFLHVKRRKVEKKKEDKDDDKDGTPDAKVSRMAIGVPGGFNPEEKKYEYDEKHNVVLIPEFKYFSLEHPEIPLAIQMSAKGILNADSAVKKEELNQASGTWDGEAVLPSKHADTLEQLEPAKQIPPKGWKCERCDLTNNLWLNLTDGSILCGRKFFDGSGGNNHAVEHYSDKKYPLAVKLGTITADGKADVFSYAEDNMVSDPHLAKHLLHFGIQINQLSKTDKSMAEIEIDMNQRIGEWAVLTEAGSKLVPVYGAGYTGMENLGNTCYMNSVMQVLLSLPPFKSAYVDGAPNYFSKVNFGDPGSDFKLQMCKLASSLWSESYSCPPTEEEKKFMGDDWQRGVKPAMFKNLIGKGHKEFSGKQQQDAQEFYIHLCTVMERQHRGEANPAESLFFDVEDRMECEKTKKVRYMSRVEDYLPLPIPMSAAINSEEVKEYEEKKAKVEAEGGRMKDDEKVRSIIPFQACLDQFCEAEMVDYTVAGEKTLLKKSMRVKTFPDYLMIQLKKFDIGPGWVPFKLDVEVQMPDEMDLSQLTAKGIQEGEEEMPKEEEPAPKAAAHAVVPDPAIVDQLLAMGFDVNGCKKAAFHTKNAGVEAAMNWVLEHNGDADFAAPFVQPGASAAAAPASSFTPSPDGLSMLLSMGMPEKKCIKALKETDNNVERAVEWIFSHPDDDGEMTEDAPPAAATGSSSGPKLTNGAPKYELAAFISHMGTSTMVGHYVCHIKREGRWVIYNDNKVALSEKPPKTLGYLYLYKRKDA